MRSDISHVLVRDGRTIPCRVIDTNGTYYETWLAAGRHDCEGVIEWGRSRYLRLRSGDGDLGVVEERELLRRSGCSRRIYRKQCTEPEPEPPCRDTPDAAFSSNLRTTTPEKRQEIRPQQSAAAPKLLPGTYLGRYEQCGAIDSWTVSYSIEQRGGEWILYFKNRGNLDSIGPLEVAQLVDAAQDAGGVRPEHFVDDLRRSGEPELAAVADEVERVTQHEIAPPVVAAAQIAREPRPDTSTYVDDGGVRYFRHRPEPVRSFEACVNIPDRCDKLLLSTPDGVHTLEIEVRAHRQGQMDPVLRVHGLAAPDGRLQVVVTNALTGESQVVEV